MGNCHGDSKSAKQNTDINKFLRDEKKRLDQEVKLLLLGAGESGKSTIAKQMKIIHLQGFTTEERMTYKTIIYNNVISSMKALITAAQNFGFAIRAKEAAERVKNAEPAYGSFSLEDIRADILALWKEDAIKSAYARQNEYQLNDSAAYYLDAIDRIAAKDYVPTEPDVLRSRAKTTGIIETEFVVEKTKFRLVDVGGQRSERKKWMHCFQDVTAVIFCVALSEYDLKLYEDDETNRMQESLKLFREICNSKWFTETSIILFLNKRDLFEEKIRRVDLTVCFQDYKGGKNYDNAVGFIKDKFLAENQNPKKHIYTHVTCATDTDNISVVFNAVKDIILHQILEDTGIGVI
jgi:GTPase SAR1 family protein